MEILICKWLAKILFMKPPVNESKEELNKEETSNTNELSSPETSIDDLTWGKKEDFENFLLLQNLILKELRCIAKKYENESEEEKHGTISRFAALVIDRFCLILFTVALTLLTTIFLFNNGEFLVADPSPIW